MFSWESLSIPSTHVLELAAGLLGLREGERRVESHVHRGNCWAPSSSSRRDCVSSTRFVSSWMESGRAEFGCVVENARTGFTLRGETRRRRASIGVSAVKREQYGSKQARARADPGHQLRPCPKLDSWFCSSLATVWTTLRCLGGEGDKKKINEIRNLRRHLNQPSSRVVTALAPTRSAFSFSPTVMSIL